MELNKNVFLGAAATILFFVMSILALSGLFTEIAVTERDSDKHNGLLALAAKRAIEAATDLQEATNEEEAMQARKALEEIASVLRTTHYEVPEHARGVQVARDFLIYWMDSPEHPKILLRRQFHALSNIASVLSVAQDPEEIAARADRIRGLAADEIPEQFEADAAWREALSDRAFAASRATGIIGPGVLAIVLFVLWLGVFKPAQAREAVAAAERERRIAEAQEAARLAEKASRAKSRFLGTMSHEIRTPMNGVIGLAEVLRTSLKDPEMKALATTLKDSGIDLLRILNDILDYTKIEAGRMELIEAPFAPSGLAVKMRALHAAEASEKDIALRVRATGDVDAARLGDVHRIAQILNNLIGNAIKFTSGGSVDVEIANEPGEALVLTVRDTGVGMTPEEARAAVMEFTQADEDATRKAAGTGLGLSIVKRLAEQMGGALDIRAAKDVGVTATVSLPLPTAPAADIAPARVPYLVAAGR